MTSQLSSLNQAAFITLPILVNMIPSGVVKSFNVTTLLGLTALLVTLAVAAVRMTSRETSRHKQTHKHTHTQADTQAERHIANPLFTRSTGLSHAGKSKTLQLINNYSLIRLHKTRHRC